MSDRSLSGQRRIYRTLLLLYPRSFRRDFGEPMTQAFCDRLQEKGTPRTWGLVVTDLIHSVPLQIMEVALMNQMWMVALAAVGTALILATTIIGLGTPISVVFLGAGTFIGLLAGLSMWLAKRSGRSTEFSYGGAAPKAWNWWTILAALLAVLYVAFATLQLIDDPKGTNVGALAIMCGFAALIVVGLRLRSRSAAAGNWMIVVATVPALLFFWAIWPTALGLAIIVGAVTEVFRTSPRASATA